MEHEDLVKQALAIRDFEQKILADPTIPGTFHTCLGQEWTAVCVMNALKKGDVIFSNHRGHGHYLAWTGDFDGLLAELKGKPNGCCGGIGGSQHLHAEGFYSNGIQGGMVPIAAGVAMGFKRRKQKNVVVCFIGDGTMGQGVVYETMNFIDAFKVPLIIVIEANAWAMYTQQQEFYPVIGNIADTFGMWHQFYDSYPNEWPRKIKANIQLSRVNQEPYIMEFWKNRLGPHSRGKETRSKEELERLWAEDWLEQQR